jgi:hypothetical protein
MLGLACLLALLALAGPQFVRMPLTNDTALYDLQASVVQHGGVLYRDILEPNLPGVVWIHLTVRSLLGGSSEAMRLFDLAVLGAILLVGAWWLSGGSARASADIHPRLCAAVWFTVAGLGFYLSISEWCHCQRDTWMLLPALIGVTLRRQQYLRCLRTPATSRVWLWAVSEGLVWGAGVWIKPYVVIPALGAFCVSHLLLRNARAFLTDAAGLLCGGLVAGGAGIAWMLSTGCWPWFLETLREWNPRYFQAGREHWTKARFVAMSARLWPWSAVHLVAVPLTLRAVLTTVIGRNRPKAEDQGLAPPRRAATPLLAAFYLAWLAHAYFLQHLFDYVHVPAVLIALLFLADLASRRAAPSNAWRVAYAGFAILALLASPIVRGERLKLWSECVAGPNSPRLQDRLAHLRNPNREDLARVAEYLRRCNVEGREVCFYNSDFVALYQSLRLTPPTRFVYLHELLVFFPDRHAEMQVQLAHAGLRYVVTDLVACGMPRQLAEQIGLEGPLAPPPAYNRGRTGFPWALPVVYRAGTYLVHKVDRPLEAMPLGSGVQNSDLAAADRIRE